MTQEQKQEWLRNATADELLRQYAEFHRTNEYGRNDADLALTKDEILRRMGGGTKAKELKEAADSRKDTK